MDFDRNEQEAFFAADDTDSRILSDKFKQQQEQQRNLQGDGIWQPVQYGASGELILKWQISKFLFQIDIHYEEETAEHPDRLKFFMRMPDQMWFAIGFGDSMIETDMIAWHADGTNSYVEDYYSKRRGAPKIDDQRDIEFIFGQVPASSPVDYPKVYFMTWRPLDTGDADEDFLIPLNENINMVWSFRSDDADWRIHIRRGYFNIELSEGLGNPDFIQKIDIGDVDVDNSDAEPGKIEDTVASDSDESEAESDNVKPVSDDDFLNGNADADVKPSKQIETVIERPTGVTPYEFLDCYPQEWAEFSLQTCYDQKSDELVFITEMPDKTWFSIGFGKDMYETDMIAWFTDSKLELYDSYDMYSFDHQAPDRDLSQDVYNEVAPVYDASTNRVLFVTRRKLDTGDEQRDFVFQLGALNEMSYAYHDSTHDFVYHSNRGVWSLTIEADGEVGDSGLSLKDLLRNEDYEQHGWWMWGAWFIVGFFLLATKRYMKKTWELNHILHAMLGYFTLIVTLIFAFKVTDFAPFENVHNAIGTLCVLVTIVGSLSGSLTAGMMRVYKGDKPWSEKEKVQRVAKIHRYFGYFMLLLGNASVMTGVGHYFGDKLQGDSRKVLGIFSLGVFIVLVAICESCYRVRNKYSMGHIENPPIHVNTRKYTVFKAADIDEQVSLGRPLVIFDNLVLDLKGYQLLHPGGKFNLMHNVGRDISKFFFGGYQLVNAPKKFPHTHSQAALDIVKTLIVGVLKDQEHTTDELFRITGSRSVTSNTSTFTFTTLDEQPVDNLRQWYNEPAMIGKHFLVYSVQNPLVKRQYTICSTMQPEIRTEIMNVANSVIDGRPFVFNLNLLQGRDQNQISLTLKTYGTKRGLATKIHVTNFDSKESAQGQNSHNNRESTEDLSVDNAFYIKGPMGKGLQIQPNGKHVAFCAGTGVLVFLDLVSQLLLKNAFESDGKKVPDEMKAYGDDFQFHLYVAFQDRESAIGLDVIEALEGVNEKLGLNNFKAIVRLSNSDALFKPPRWTPQYIEEQLTPLKDTLSRVWVCGPPSLNETFDKTLEAIGPMINLKPSQYEIM